MGQQMANAGAAERYGQAQFEATKKAAVDDAIRGYSALQARQSQENAKAAQAVDQASLAARRAASTSRTSAGESGAFGGVAAELADEFKRTELNFQTTVIRNQTMLDAQFRNELEGVHAQEYGRILAGQPGPVAQPDLLGGALNAFGKILEINQKSKEKSPVNG